MAVEAARRESVGEAVEKMAKRLVYEVVLSEDKGNFKFGKATMPDETKADDLRKLVLDVRGRIGESRPSVVVAVAAALDRHPARADRCHAPPRCGRARDRLWHRQLRSRARRLSGRAALLRVRPI